jgi:hypothetical protein
MWQRAEWPVRYMGTHLVAWLSNGAEGWVNSSIQFAYTPVANRFELLAVIKLNRISLWAYTKCTRRDQRYERIQTEIFRLWRQTMLPNFEGTSPYLWPQAERYDGMLSAFLFINRTVASDFPVLPDIYLSLFTSFLLFFVTIYVSDPQKVCHFMASGVPWIFIINCV